VVRRNHILAGDELKTLKSNTQFDTLQVANYIHPTENKGVYAMGSNYKLAVDLFMARNNPMLQNMPYASRNGITIATIEFTEPYLYFDSNGSILNPLGAIFGNSWGYNRVAHLLPVDYWPSASE
jgi:hypothetical protein